MFVKDKDLKAYKVTVTKITSDLYERLGELKKEMAKLKKENAEIKKKLGEKPKEKTVSELTTKKDEEDAATYNEVMDEWMNGSKENGDG